MGVFNGFEPQAVLRYFEELSKIPRGSGNTKGIADYCVAFAKAHNLEFIRDECDNVIIRKPASVGYESALPIILQGHLDMVCVQDNDSDKNMETEGLELFVEGDLVGAKGTSLGADNGAAVAMILAILESSEIAHPELEAVLTSDEEVGMIGAVKLDMSVLKSRRMLNIDSEEEGIFTVSCAGGCSEACILPINREAFDGKAIGITVGGLRGGHSGIEIHKGRGNANAIMARALAAIAAATDMRIVRVDGGVRENAIASNAAALVCVADESKAIAAIKALDAVLKNEFCSTDPDVFVIAKACEAEVLPMDKESADRVLCLTLCLPNGVQVMSAEIDGLVQTSLNFGVLSTENDRVIAAISIRSSVESQKQMLSQKLKTLTAQLGGTTESSGEYPSWEYQKNSALQALMERVYEEQSGQPPVIQAIHAGLECGLFIGKIPGLVCVSYGSDLFDVHTPRERMSIQSLNRVWNFTIELLKRMK